MSWTKNGWSLKHCKKKSWIKLSSRSNTFRTYCRSRRKEINESIHISAVKLPDNVRPTITDRDFTIATVAAPTVVKEPEPAAAVEGAAAEGAEGAEPNAAWDASAKTPEDKTKAPAENKKK